MKVNELIDLLQKCNPDDLVMYDAEPALGSLDWFLCDNAGENVTEEYPHFGIENVLVGKGTMRGTVYLAEEPLPEMQG